MTPQTLDWIRAPQVAFAQVREDPEIDLCLLRQTRHRRALVIASGGCTAARLAPEIDEILWLADRNPAQLALAREKLEQLPHSPAERRKWAAGGKDQAGKYERLFEHLRRQTGDLRDLLAASAPLAHPKWPVVRQACREVFADDPLREIFGAEATQGTFRSFADHFVERLESALDSPIRFHNPWLAQMLAGEFLDAVYPWLEQPPARLSIPIPDFCGDLAEHWPESARSLDFIGLSNITDWMPEDRAARCVRLAWERMAPGGVLVMRQLNSRHAFDETVPAIRWDDAAAAALHSRDRSFFYRRLWVARKEG